MHTVESIIAGGMGIAGAAGIMVPIVAQLDPITPGAKLAQLGVPGIMGVALVSVTWAFMWALRNKDKIMAERVAELHEDREAYAKILAETRTALVEMHTGLTSNTEAITTLTAEHRTVMQRIEVALDAISKNMAASTTAITDLIRATKYCEEQALRNGPYTGPDRRRRGTPG